jgi:hypothetical protein
MFFIHIVIHNLLAQLGNPPRKQENPKLGKGNFVGTNSLCRKLIAYAQMFAYSIDENILLTL